MRLFIALELPLFIQETLVDQMNNWKAKNVRGRFCSPQNLHLTLVFLGDQSKTACTQVETILKTLSFPKMILSLQQVGFFKDLCYASIESQALQAYVTALRKKLKEAGFVFDTKPFKAHITLIRKVSVPNPMQLTLRPMQFEAKCCTLFSSQLTPQGPIYTPLCEIFPSN